jgi:DNA-binding transcriptional LysR family regulator
MRNLDMTALRSFVAVAEVGGVTKAAGFLNLTQSAVSMQIKRLEDMLDVTLLDRKGRGVTLTAAGEQLAGYARRMLSLNDEVFGRLTHQAFEGKVTLGVPHDIVYPAIPQVLQRFNAEFPRMNVHLVSSYTTELRRMFGRGECDMILTTEDSCDPGGETLLTLPLVWIGAPGGSAWKATPLPLAYEHSCIFRKSVQEALDGAGIPWDLMVESESTRTIEASVSADLAVHTVLEGMEPSQLERINHGGALPDLVSKQINMYVGDLAKGQIADHLAGLLRQAFAGM